MCQSRIRGLAQFSDDVAHLWQTAGFSARQPCARQILHQIRKQDAIGRKRSGFAREDHFRDAHFLSNFDGVQPASTAEGQQREVTWIEPFFK